MFATNLSERKWFFIAINQSIFFLKTACQIWKTLFSAFLSFCDQRKKRTYIYHSKNFINVLMGPKNMKIYINLQYEIFRIPNLRSEKLIFE